MSKAERPVIALDVGGSSVKSALVAADQQIVGDYAWMLSKARQLLMRSSIDLRRLSLVTGGISEAWDRFAPTLIESLSVPVVRGVLGNRAALLGAAALY